ncbi:MAG: hypothetical protein KA116_07205 [Proteobacteria bacterium]|nr:hypothetical protein [Pseudomonadota bacterium]
MIKIRPFQTCLWTMVYLFSLNSIAETPAAKNVVYVAQKTVQRGIIHIDAQGKITKTFFEFQKGDKLKPLGLLDEKFLPVTNKDCNYIFNIERNGEVTGDYGMPEQDFNTLTLGLTGKVELYRWSSFNIPEIISSNSENASKLFHKDAVLKKVSSNDDSITLGGVTKSTSGIHVEISKAHKDVDFYQMPFSQVPLENEMGFFDKNKIAEANDDSSRDLFKELNEYESMNYQFHTVEVIDSKNLPEGVKLHQRLWVASVEENGPNLIAYALPKKDKTFIIPKENLQLFNNVSQLKAHVAEDRSSEIVAQAGQYIYERGFDKDVVHYSVCGDPEARIYDLPIEDYKKFTLSQNENYNPAKHDHLNKLAPSAPQPIAPDPDKGVEGSQRQYLAEEENNAGNVHTSSELPKWRKSNEDLIQPKNKDCAPKGDKENAPYYVLKKPIPLDKRRQYKDYIIAAANKCQIHPAILEASLHIETDMNEKKENKTELKSVLNKLKKNATYEDAENYVIKNKKDIWGKSLAQISPVEAKIYGYNWTGKYSETAAKDPKSIWNPKNAIMATAMVMKNFRDSSAVTTARSRGMNVADATAHMFNRPGEEGFAEQARYILSMFNRGVRAVKALDLYVDQHDQWPASYGQVWAEMPKNEINLSAKKRTPGYLWGQDINRGHVYKGAGLCGPLPKWSLVAQYRKEYSESIGPDGKKVWKSIVMFIENILSPFKKLFVASGAEVK